MSKRIAIIEILFLCISIFALMLQSYFIFVPALFVTVFIFISILLDKSNLKKSWKKEHDLLRDDRRNYSSINIGYKKVDDEGLDLTVKHSNLYSDFLIMQRYYSLGKSGCIIKVNMKNSHSYLNVRRLSLFTLDMLHDVTLLEHGAFYYSYKVKWKTVFNSFLYFVCNIRDDIQMCKKEKVDYSLLTEMNSFAEKRGMSICWYLNGKKIKESDIK